MKKLNPRYIERVNQLADTRPYLDLLSMKIRDVGIGYSINPQLTGGRDG